MRFLLDRHMDPKPYYAGAFGIGVMAAAVMTVALWLMRGLGLTDLSLAMTIGTSTLFTDDPSPGAWVQGFIVVLIFGGLFALVYAAVMEMWGRPRAWRGALIGVVHAPLGGLLLGWLMPLIHPPMPRAPLLSDPGFMGFHHGLGTVVIFLMLHVIYGAVVGGWLHYAARRLTLPLHEEEEPEPAAPV